jgi:hypothetical protein
MLTFRFDFSTIMWSFTIKLCVNSENTWYLMLKPLYPWHLAPRNEDRINESISENFCLDNHHSENTGNGIPPRLPTE